MAADLTGDGRVDLAVSDADTGSVTLLAAAAPGAWAQSWAIPTLPVARALAAADLDSDGRLDLVVTSGKSNQVMVLFGDPAGEPRPVALPAGSAPFDVAVVDLDGDGFLDLAVASESNDRSPDTPGDVTLLYGDGAGGFPRRRTLAAGVYPAALAVADLDRDGRPDLAVANWGSGDVSLFRTAPGGTLAPAGRIAHGGGPAYGIAAADLDGDGAPDLAVPDVAGRVHVLVNDGGGGLTPAGSFAVGVGVRDVIAADLDGDGRPELVTADTAEHTVSILRNLGSGRFAPRQVIPVGTRPRQVIAADLDGDGRTDLAVTEGGAGMVGVLRATESGGTHPDAGTR